MGGASMAGTGCDEEQQCEKKPHTFQPPLPSLVLGGKGWLKSTWFFFMLLLLVAAIPGTGRRG